MLSFHPNNATWRDVMRVNINPWLTVDPPTYLAQDLLPLPSHSSWVWKDIYWILLLNIVHFSFFPAKPKLPTHLASTISELPLKEGLQKATIQRKARVTAKQTFPMKLVKRSWKLLQVHKSEEDKDHWDLAEDLSQSSMWRINWPSQPNTLYTLEAERHVLDKFGFNDIFIVSKKLKSLRTNISTHQELQAAALGL